MYAKLVGHKVPVTKLLPLGSREPGGPDLLLSAAQDGSVSLWDPSGNLPKGPDKEVLLPLALMHPASLTVPQDLRISDLLCTVNPSLSTVLASLAPLPPSLGLSLPPSWLCPFLSSLKSPKRIAVIESLCTIICIAMAGRKEGMEIGRKGREGKRSTSFEPKGSMIQKNPFESKGPSRRWSIAGGTGGDLQGA